MTRLSDRRRGVAATTPAPLCSWPSGCRKRTLDLSGRCPHHRNVSPAGGADAVGLFPDLGPSGDPFAPTEAERLAAVVYGQREAVLLADRGVTVETWPVWRQAAGGGSDAGAIVIAAIDSGIRLEDLDALPGAKDKLGAYVRLPPRGRGGRFLYDGRAVVAWADAYPHLEPADIVGLLHAGLVPDSPAFQDLAAVGVPPELAAGWHLSGRRPDHAAGWAKLGVPAHEAGLIEAHDVTAADLAAAAAMPDSYPGPAGDRMFLRRAGRLAMWAAGVPEPVADAYADAGAVGVAAGLLPRFGVTPADYAAYADAGGDDSPLARARQVPVDVVLDCARAGAVPADAAVWRRCGVSTGGWVAAARAGAVGADAYDTLLAPGSHTLDRALERSDLDLPDGEALKLLQRSDRTSNGRSVAFAFVARGACPPRLAAAAAADPGNPARFDVAAAGSSRPDADPDLLDVAAVAPDPWVRANAARHTSVRPATLTALAADPDQTVRAVAAANPDLPAAGRSAAGLLSD